MYIPKMYDDVVQFVNGKTSINELQKYVNLYHPELEFSQNTSENWQGRVIRRAAAWNNSELIRDFVNIAGKHILNAKATDDYLRDDYEDDIPIVADCFAIGMKNLQQLDTISTLVDLGASVNSVSVSMGSPLHMAKAQKNIPAISLLESYGAIDIPPTKKVSGFEW